MSISNLWRRGGRKLIMTPEDATASPRKPTRDGTLIKALIRARLLPLTCLTPEIVEAILDGRQPKGLRLPEMLENGSLLVG
jgi:hypothetical protein